MPGGEEAAQGARRVRQWRRYQALLLVAENQSACEVATALGAAPLIDTPSSLLTVAAMVTVKARHAGVWAALNQKMDFSGKCGAFDVGIGKATMGKAVAPFFVGGM